MRSWGATPRRKVRLAWRGSSFLLIGLLAAPAVAADGAVAPGSGGKDSAVAELYGRTIRSVLEQQCVGCHGGENAFGKLDLRTREAALRGGQSGPSIVPGDAAGSLLVKAIERTGTLKMPPGEDDKKLPDSTIKAFREWIDGGAPFLDATVAYEWGKFRDEDLWALRPVAKVAVPTQGINLALVQTPVDAFVLRKLAEKGVMPAGRVDRRTLIRRATIDLTGLPPTPEEVEAFVNDPSPTAFKTVVERLLDSPHYGERWGRHWLDVVRYADSSGFSNDFERPNAWRYRDYVIRAFNDDKPYDRFIREQVAGDELYPDEPEALIATGFLRSGPWEQTAMEVAAVQRQLFLDDVTHMTGETFLGLTLGCARCHDHKFDPIPTRDYYSMQAAFATTEFARRDVAFLDRENHDGFVDGEDHLQRIIERTQEKLDSFAEITRRYLIEKYGVKSIDELPADRVKDAIRQREGISPEDYEALKLYQKHLSMYRESEDRYKPLAFSVSSGPHNGKIDNGPAVSGDVKEGEYAVSDTYVLVGGNLQAHGPKVEPGVVEALERYSGFPPPAMPETLAGRRAALAKWIADTGNPLTARVMVNRIWQYHFGKGLAENSNNFGKMGKKPTHPELLDWLARYFVEQGWSVKAVHRVIMLSEAYQRSGDHPDFDAVAKGDPENTLLAYYPPRRVEAEVLRDSILAVSGELSDDTGGPGTFPQINSDLADQPRHAMGSLRPAYRASPTKRKRNRRSIYSFQARSLVDPLIEVFNGAGMDMSCERRDATTVPTQAFSLLNSELSHDMALAVALRLQRERTDLAEQVKRAFELAYGRPAAVREVELALAHVEKMTALHRETPPPPKQPREPLVRSITSELTGENFRFEEQEDPAEYEENVHSSEVDAPTRALADFALVLFNSNEFVYVY